MNASMDERHRKELVDAQVAVERVRLAAKVSVGLGLVGFV